MITSNLINNDLPEMKVVKNPYCQLQILLVRKFPEMK